MEYIFQSTRPMRGATQGNARHHQWPVYFNPRAPCGARRAVQEQYAPNQHFDPRAPCGARPGEFINNGPLQGAFQSTRPMRGATLKASALVSYHSFQSTRPMRGATAKVYKITLHTFATKGNSWTISRKTLPFKAFCRLQIGKNFSICGANRCGNFCELLLRTIRSSVLPEGRSACSQNAQFYSHTFSRDNRNADCLFPDP